MRLNLLQLDGLHINIMDGIHFVLFIYKFLNFQHKL